MSGPMSGPVYPELREPQAAWRCMHCQRTSWRQWWLEPAAWPRYMIVVFAVLFTWGGLTLGLTLGIDDKSGTEIDRPVKIGRAE